MNRVGCVPGFRLLHCLVPFLGIIGMAVPPPVLAADPGQAAYTFLKIGTDARAEAMGGAYTGLADGMGALFYNPAGAALAAPRQVVATYNNWVTDIQSGFLGGLWQLGADGRIGASIQYLNYGNFRAANAQGDRLPDFGASDVAMSVTWARPAATHSSFGATARLIAESIDNESSWGLAVDFGFLHHFPDERTRLGLAIRNAGFQLKGFGQGAKDKLPFTGVVGLSHRLQGAPLLFAVDLIKPYDDKLGASLGTELSAFDPFFVRAGYSTLAGRIDTGSGNDKWAGLNLGAGFSKSRITIDYAFGLMSQLGSTHRFTIRTAI